MVTPRAHSLAIERARGVATGVTTTTRDRRDVHSPFERDVGRWTSKSLDDDARARASERGREMKRERAQTSANARARSNGDDILSSILGHMKEASAKRARAPAISRVDVESQEAKHARARAEFERDARAKIERDVVMNANDDAYCEFEVMEKPWRNVVHEIAREMKVHSESVETADGGKYVAVMKKAGEVERDVESLRNEVAARERAMKGKRKGEGASDKAPTYAGESMELRTVGTVKRDLRSVEETIADLKREKAARVET